MTTTNQRLNELATAAKAERALLQRVQQARARRDRVIWDLYHEQGLGYGTIAKIVQEKLLAKGFTEAELTDRNSMGVSPASVRKVVTAPRP